MLLQRPLASLGGSAALVALAVMLMFMAQGQVIHATHPKTITITVGTTDDELNSDGVCSLREAIQAANSDAAVDACPAGSGADTIVVPAGTYTLSSGDLDITADLTISGAGAVSTIVDGDALDRVFHVLAGNTVEIADVTVRNGASGGISNFGALTLNNTTVSGNSAVNTGGGISNFGTLILNNTTVSGNSVGNVGGGIFSSGTMTLNNSTVSGNSAGNTGGGISDGGGGGTLTLNNTTVSGNTAGNTGGGIRNSGTLTLNNTTVSGNTAGNTGASIRNTGSVSIKNTILASIGAECSGTLISFGHNLSEDSSCGLTAIGDLQNTSPLLGTMANNGGPTQTHALLAGSSAIDAGNPATPGSGTNACEATDQRGVARPQGAACDIGAFEELVGGAPTSTPCPPEGCPTATPTPTLTPTFTPTATPLSPPATVAPTATPLSPTATLAPADTPTVTPTAMSTPTPAPTEASIALSIGIPGACDTLNGNAKCNLLPDASFTLDIDVDDVQAIPELASGYSGVQMVIF